MPYQNCFSRYLLRALFVTTFLGAAAIPSMAQCSYSVNPGTTPDIAAIGGTGTFQLQTQTNCDWAALPNVPWIVITSVFSGTGSATVTFQAQFNPTETNRSGAINIGGQTVNVNQLGNPACVATSLSVNSTRTGNLANGDCRSEGQGVNFYADRFTFAGDAGQTVFAGVRSDNFNTLLRIKAPNGTIFTNAGGGGGNNSRIPADKGLLTLPVTGIYQVEVTSLNVLQTGSYSLDLYQASGTESDQQANRVRLGVPSFYSQTIATATEEGADPAQSCNAGQRGFRTLWFEVTPTFSGTLDVSTAGSGYDTVLSVYQAGAEVACNNDALTGGVTSRLTANVVAGQAYLIEVASVTSNPAATNMFLTIAPAGGSCVYQLGSPSQQVNSIGGNFSFSIVTSSACAWQAQSNVSWINVTSGSGLGSGSISYTVGANITGAQRTGTITIAGLTFTVTQLAGSCTFTLSPTSQTFPIGGGTGQITVDTQAGCSWTTANIANWVSLNKSGGTGPDVVSYLVQQNNTGATRQASVTIGTQSFSITQTTSSTNLTITQPASNQVITVAGVTFQWTAVTNATGYEARISSGGSTVFSGLLSGSGSNSTLVSLPNGNYTFSVRDCLGGGFGDSFCSGFSSVNFAVVLGTPSARPTITSPTAGQVFTTSTQTFSWSTVGDASYYEIELRNLTAGVTEYSFASFGSPPPTSTVFTMRGANYSLRVRACISACGDWSDAIAFSVNLPATPTAAPGTPSCSVAGGNQLTCAWGAVTGADFYLVQAVQPNTGPGGGALTVASRFVNTNGLSTPLLVPAGPFSVFIAACNGNGCGPYTAPLPLNAAGPSPASPVLGNPLGGAITSAQPVFFSWNRVPSDNGSNTIYRLFVADLSRGSTALDILTTSNFYSASFKGNGSRYDAIVVANPDTVNQVIGPASGFILQGVNPTSPTLVQPRHQTPEVTSTISGGNVQLGWTVVPGSTLYEYFVAISGQPNPIVRGVTPGLVVQVPLGAAGGNITTYSGIVRACLPGSACVFGSEAGWGPWSNQPGGAGVTTFLVRP